MAVSYVNGAARQAGAPTEVAGSPPLHSHDPLDTDYRPCQYHNIQQLTMCVAVCVRVQGRNFGLKVGVPIQEEENMEMGSPFNWGIGERRELS